MAYGYEIKAATPHEKNSIAIPRSVHRELGPLWHRTIAIAWGLAAIAVFLQMLTNGRYGYFRDELYFIATSKPLAFAYVDFAPLAAFVLRVSRDLFGDSLHAISPLSGSGLWSRSPAYGAYHN